jgi:Ser/Thr protein kinase RdoA (MazF antagonist)
MLAETIAQEFGLTVTSQRRLPGGYTSKCWLVATSDGPYVAKVWRWRPPTDGWIRLTDELHRRGLRVPYPIRTLRGDVVVESPDGPLCLLAYVDGVSPPEWPHWPAPVLEALGRFLADLHAVPAEFAAPIDLAPPVADLRQVDDDLAAEFREQIERLEALREAAKLAAAPWVVCHTDAGGDNLYVDANGRLGVLDWDHAALAPAESDFILVARDQRDRGPLSHVVRGYGHDPDPDRLRYFLLRRYLGDAAARISQLAEPGANRVELLEGVNEWGVRLWRRLR